MTSGLCLRNQLQQQILLLFEDFSINVSNRFEPFSSSTPVKARNDIKTSQQKKPISQPAPKQRPIQHASTKSTEKHSNIISLSSRKLSDPEASVLELGLTFCPSVKSYDKEKVADDFYHFIRRLKLKEYFHDKPITSSPELPSFDEDRTDMNWIPKNPDWYPDEVQKNRSPSLQKFISKLLSDSKDNLSANQDSFWSNLDYAQREAIKSLAEDDSIVIKPSDKDGSVVIMNTKDYENECLLHLNNTVFYQELDNDPNGEYKKLFLDEIEKLRDDQLITKVENEMLQQGHRTPLFYGLPKTHKPYDKLPKLRPICSGHSSASVRMSELVDSFLKAAAMKTRSYVKDTTDFINKIRYITTEKENDAFLVTMDVESLYPNIDHQEGVAACEGFLNKRNKQTFPTSRISKLIRLILSTNTLKFLDKFYHQIKGTAMGTPMAVNFANLFLAEFEERLLDAYQKEYKISPHTWLRYIDDVFFIWTGTEDSLKHFLQFCNSFAERSNMKSVISFTSHYSRTSVNFLDTTVKLEDSKISTTLYSKPTSSHDYLHRSSYHVKHVLKSLPLSQFIRIRRICSNLSDYWTNANEFIHHFRERGYKESELRKCAQTVSSRDREELLTYKRKESNNRVPLVLTFHHKLRDIPGILHNNYKKMIKENPDMKAIFPEPPMVSYRRAKNLSDRLIKADHTKKKSPPVTSRRDATAAEIDHQLNDSGKIVNLQTKATYNICGGKATDSDVIYAATCTKHQKVYVGQTKQPLNLRFNGHRSDIIHYPDRCELDSHFSKNNCDFKSDLSISILEKVSGSTNLREYYEDKWMIRLSSLEPYGLNSMHKDFVSVYQKLF